MQPEELDVAIAIDRIERAASFRVTQVRRKWAGLRTFAPDRAPVVGMEESMPGFFWLAGQGGYGIQIAPALARTAAKLLVEGVVPDDLLGRPGCRESPAAAPADRQVVGSPVNCLTGLTWAGGVS